MKKLLAVLCVVFLLGADTKDDGKKDAEKLQGKWVVKSAERGGKAVDLDKEEHVPKSITIKGDTFTMDTKNGEHKGSFKVGREDKLKTIDMTPDDPNEKDRVLKAIYRLEGDTLTICVNEGKLSERPTEISAKEGSHKVVGVFTREKTK
jgi:uncharacterized protein (TIGR03067 family)